MGEFYLSKLLNPTQAGRIASDAMGGIFRLIDLIEKDQSEAAGELFKVAAL